MVTKAPVLVEGQSAWRSPKIIALSVLVFLLIYNISFTRFPLLTTGRLSIILLTGWALFFSKTSPVAWLRSRRILLIFIPLPYVFAQFMMVGDLGQLSRFLHLALYSVLGAALVASIAKSPRDAMLSVLIAISVQSIFLPYAFVSPSYRDWFSANVESGANYAADYLYRSNGFSGYAGAALSLIQSLGVFVGWMLLRHTKGSWPGTGFRASVVVIAMIVCLMSCVLVGRTGLVLSIVFFLGYLLDPAAADRMGRTRQWFVIFLFAVVGYFFVRYYFADLLSDNFSFDYFSTWALGFLWGEDNTGAAIAQMTIPPLGLDTVLGTGLVSLVDGSNPSGHDSGFIQSYYSMGLLMSVVLYMMYIYLLYYSLRWLPLGLRLFFAATFFMLDLKEPFLFKYSLLFVVLVLHFSYARTLKRSAYSAP